MRTLFISMLLVTLSVNSVHSGLSLGAGGAVLKRVKKLDNKVIRIAPPPDPCVVTHCTVVGGYWPYNTTWMAAYSPYSLGADLEVAGAVFTIEPGVVVYGNGHSIKITNTLSAVGNNSQKIIFNNVSIYGETAGSVLDIEFAEMTSVSIYTNLSSFQGSLILKDSSIESASYLSVAYPGSDSYIERNIFTNSNRIEAATSGPQIHIRNNVFYRQNGYAVSNGYNNSILVEKNSFLSTDRIALKLDSTNAQITAINNYWNTTDPSVIDGMIYDKNDSGIITNAIVYTPFLSAPDPATPVFP